MDSSQVSRTRLQSGSSNLRQELNDLLGRQLSAHKGMAMAIAPEPGKKSQVNAKCDHFTQTGPLSPPAIPPRPPHTLRPVLSRQLSETNRLLLKEMIEKNRSRRKLSNAGAKENRASAPCESCIIANPYVDDNNTQLQSQVVQSLPPVEPAAAASVSVPSDDFAIVQLQDTNIDDAVVASSLEEVTTTLDSAEISGNLHENSGPIDLIDFSISSENDRAPVELATEEPQQEPSATAVDSASGAPAVWLPEAGASALTRALNIAASSQSLDSFLQSAPTSSANIHPETAAAVSQSSTSLASLASSNTSYDDSAGELKVSNKVVWFTPLGVPETGTVRWIGKLKDRYHAGVEFVRPVGNSSGLHGGRKLFDCRLTHGRFVPVSELILHIDFYAGSASNEPSPYSCGIPTEECDAEAKAFSEPPIICVICQDSLIISASIDEEEDSGPTIPMSKSAKKNLSKSMDELSTKSSRMSTVRNTASAPSSSRNKEMVATRCGHLFHSDCLSQWFSLKRRMHQPCPFCQHPMHVQDTIRIYPVQGTI